MSQSAVAAALVASACDLARQLGTGLELDDDLARHRIQSGAAGVDAPGIGRLELRLSARHARVDGSSVASVNARLLRRF